MAIIESQTHQALSLDQKKVLEKARIKYLASSAFNQIKADMENIFAHVWQNKRLTQEQVLEALGTEARELFVMSGVMKHALNTIMPNSITLSPPKKFTINEDGSIVLNDGE